MTDDAPRQALSDLFDELCLKAALKHGRSSLLLKTQKRKNTQDSVFYFSS
jgi:hypothetical protein